ncbi:hypothetical protein CBM2615_B180063 [Cupriavidus taiwanensis]|nr:hypothetical protein CBM2615_B180063 [Cupriavidus taiwanensis]
MVTEMENSLPFSDISHTVCHQDRSKQNRQRPQQGTAPAHHEHKSKRRPSMSEVVAKRAQVTPAAA